MRTNINVAGIVSKSALFISLANFDAFEKCTLRHLSQYWTFEARTKIDAIGARLLEMEARETYLDGGRSQQGIIDDLRAANADLQRLITS